MAVVSRPEAACNSDVQGVDREVETCFVVDMRLTYRYNGRVTLRFAIDHIGYDRDSSLPPRLRRTSAGAKVNF